jgi:hypothetical protein
LGQARGANRPGLREVNIFTGPTQCDKSGDRIQLKSFSVIPANESSPSGLNQKSTLKLQNYDGRNRSQIVDSETKLLEITRSIDNQGTADNRLEYKSMTINMNEDNKPADPDVQAKIQQITQNITNVSGNTLIDRNNKTLKNQIVLGPVPAQLRRDLIKLHEEIRQAIEAVNVPMPANPSVQPLATWTHKRILPVTTLGESSRASMEMTYTFLGTRTRAGRQEAVIGMKGQLHGGDDDDLKITGRADGTSVLDLTAGQIASADLTTIIDMNMNLGPISVKANGTVETKLQRTLTAK